jgi:hypothetical protein
MLKSQTTIAKWRCQDPPNLSVSWSHLILHIKNQRPLYAQGLLGKGTPVAWFSGLILETSI